MNQYCSKSIFTPSVHMSNVMLSQAAPAQKNLGTSGEVEVMQPAQASASRTQAVGVASQLRTAAFKLLLMGCRSSGAAFIKWGQWSATREDIFPAVSVAVSTLLSLVLLEKTYLLQYVSTGSVIFSGPLLEKTSALH